MDHRHSALEDIARFSYTRGAPHPADAALRAWWDERPDDVVAYTLQALSEGVPEDFCMLLHRLPPDTARWRVVVAAMLSHAVVEIRDAGTQAAESWGAYMDLLREASEREPVLWLRVYMERAINHYDDRVQRMAEHRARAPVQRAGRVATG